MQRPTEWQAFKAHSGTVSVSTTIMEHQMFKNIQLSTAFFATALLGGVALAPMIASAHPTERTVKAEPARHLVACRMGLPTFHVG